MENVVMKFIRESNKIEGIDRDPTSAEIKEFKRFMTLSQVTVEDLEQFIRVYQPDAMLRDRPEVPGVRVGNHIAPKSGTHIRRELGNILFHACEFKDTGSGSGHPFDTHIKYETLHPFTDGNGRSGRMLWAWQMGWNGLSLGFLHRFYYQTLDAQR